MENAPYGWRLPIDVSVHGAEIDHLITIIHYFMLVLFVGWGIFFVYCLIKFRAREGHKAKAVHKHFKLPTYLEFVILAIEVVLLIGVSMPIWNRVKHDFPDAKDAQVVRIVAEQFAWNVHYPGRDGKFGRTATNLMDGTNPVGLDREDPDAKDDIVSINNLHIVVNKPVIVHLMSKDVIHSFFLPVMRVKQDVIPGMEIPIWFTAKETGEFEIACAQLCGLGHYRMRGMLHIDTPEQYEAFLQEEEKALRGEF